MKPVWWNFKKYPFIWHFSPVNLDFRCKIPTLGAKATLGAKPICGATDKLYPSGSNNNGHYSKRKIKAMVHSVYVLKSFDFSDKQKFLEDLYERCNTFDEAISYISKKLRVKESFIRHRM